MGTRYVITRQDVEEKLGLAVEETVTEIPEYGEDDMEVVSVTVIRGFTVGVGGWAFDSYGGREFHGPKVGKPDLDALFRASGVKPDWC